MPKVQSPFLPDANTNIFVDGKMQEGEGAESHSLIGLSAQDNRQLARITMRIILNQATETVIQMKKMAHPDEPNFVVSEASAIMEILKADFVQNLDITPEATIYIVTQMVPGAVHNLFTAVERILRLRAMKNAFQDLRQSLEGDDFISNLEKLKNNAKKDKDYDMVLDVLRELKEHEETQE